MNVNRLHQIHLILSLYECYRSANFYLKALNPGGTVILFIPSYVGCLWIVALTNAGLVNRILGNLLLLINFYMSVFRLLYQFGLLTQINTGNFPIIEAVHNPSSDLKSEKEHVFGVLVFQKPSGSDSSVIGTPIQQSRKPVIGTRKKTLLPGSLFNKCQLYFNTTTFSSGPMIYSHV